MNKHSAILELIKHYRSTGSTKSLSCNLVFIVPTDFPDGIHVDVCYMYDSDDAIIGSYQNHNIMDGINEIKKSKGGGYSLCKSSTGTKVQIQGVTYDTSSTEDMFQLSTMCNPIEYDLLKIANTLSEYKCIKITLYCTEDNVPSTEELIEYYNSVSAVKFELPVLEEHDE